MSRSRDGPHICYYTVYHNRANDAHSEMIRGVIKGGTIQGYKPCVWFLKGSTDTFNCQHRHQAKRNCRITVKGSEHPRASNNDDVECFNVLCDHVGTNFTLKQTKFA